MRINENISPIDEYSSESRVYLEKIIRMVLFNPPPPIPRVPEEEIDPNTREFYDNYYVEVNSHGYVPPDCELQSLTISSYEQELITFCQDPRSETRIFVLYGHTGVGKTSLLRRFVYHVYPKCPNLRDRFIPVYVRLTEALTEGKPQEVSWKIAEIVCSATYRIVRDILLDDFSHILQELNLRGRFVSRFSGKTIQQAISSDLEDWLDSFCKDQRDRIEFLKEVLVLLIREQKLMPVPIIDDVDQHSSEIHGRIFSALDILASDGFASIVAMRTSTYRSFSAQATNYRDDNIELTLDSKLVHRILKCRIDLADSIRLQPEIPYRIPKYDQVSGEDVADSFCSLISHSACMKALIRLSNTNLKSMFRKLELMTRSEACSDAFIVHQLFDRDVAVQRKTLPSKIWIFYHLLLGTYAGTFKRGKEARKAGLINAFDCSGPSQSPWRHFIRVNLLHYLYRREAVIEDEFVQVADLHEDLKSAFGNTVDNLLLKDTLWALIQAELVFMESCRKYKKMSLTDHVFSDSIRISSAGIFYVDNLLHKVEYLYFVKDDVDWDIQERPDGLIRASRDYNRRAKFSSILEALRLLIAGEYLCLELLEFNWKDKDNGKDALRFYRDHFSPYGHPGSNALLISEAILHSYSKFIKRTLGESFPGSTEAQLIAELASIRDEYEATRQAFLQA